MVHDDRESASEPPATWRSRILGAVRGEVQAYILALLIPILLISGAIYGIGTIKKALGITTIEQHLAEMQKYLATSADTTFSVYYDFNMPELSEAGKLIGSADVEEQLEALDENFSAFQTRLEDRDRNAVVLSGNAEWRERQYEKWKRTPVSLRPANFNAFLRAMGEPGQETQDEKKKRYKAEYKTWRKLRANLDRELTRSFTFYAFDGAKVRLNYEFACENSEGNPVKDPAHFEVHVNGKFVRQFSQDDFVSAGKASLHTENYLNDAESGRGVIELEKEVTTYRHTLNITVFPHKDRQHSGKNKRPLEAIANGIKRCTFGATIFVRDTPPELKLEDLQTWLEAKANEE